MNTNLLHLDVPAGMTVDPEGLIESWLMGVEDWLETHKLSPELTQQKAFEGVELLGSLRRCDPARLAVIPAATLADTLADTLAAYGHAAVFSAACEYVTPEAWVEQTRQALRAYRSKLQDFATAQSLLQDMDALDFLVWYGTENLAESGNTIAPSLTEKIVRLDADVAACQACFNESMLLWGAAEPYVRAVGLTMPEDLQLPDPTGLLMLSAAKYIAILCPL